MGEQSEDDADIVGLKTTILETEYLRCKTFLTEISGKSSSQGAISYLRPGWTWSLRSQKCQQD